jgi:hypothetical protein
MAICHCSTCGPKGKEVTKNEKRKHERNDLGDLALRNGEGLEGSSVMEVRYITAQLDETKLQT